MTLIRFALVALCALTLSACAETEFLSHVAKQGHHRKAQTEGRFKVGNPYQVDGRWYYPQETYEHTETGIASWYGPGFDGKRTASGEVFHQGELTAAHRTLQMPSLVRVTNLDNGKSVVVRVNDRGPFKRNRVMDVSTRAAELLGFKGIGTAKVKLELLADASRLAAMSAKSGKDTRGMEVAYNEGGTAAAGGGPLGPPDQVMGEDMPRGYQTASLSPVERESLSAGAGPPIQGHYLDGRFMPDPVVSREPVRPTSIFVQAGSFTVAENATKLSQKLSALASSRVVPTVVNGRSFYRVRLGPIATVEEADALIGRVIASGQPDAITIVD